MAPPADDHDCGWKAYAQSLEERLAALEKKAFGKKSEKLQTSKLPPAVSPRPVSQDEQKRRREALAQLREAHLETEETKVAVEACTCDKCGSAELHEIGGEKPSTTYEYVSAHFRKRVHLRQTLSCSCGHIITAKAPERMGEKTRYIGENGVGCHGPLPLGL